MEVLPLYLFQSDGAVGPDQLDRTGQVLFLEKWWFITKRGPKHGKYAKIHVSLGIS